MYLFYNFMLYECLRSLGWVEHEVPSPEGTMKVWLHRSGIVVYRQS